MNSLKLTYGINSLANAIACKLSAEELALLATILVQLGDTLATIATHKTVCKSAKKENPLPPTDCHA